MCTAIRKTPHRDCSDVTAFDPAPFARGASRVVWAARMQEGGSHAGGPAGAWARTGAPPRMVPLAEATGPQTWRGTECPEKLVTWDPYMGFQETRGLDTSSMLAPLL